MLKFKTPLNCFVKDFKTFSERGPRPPPPKEATTTAAAAAATTIITTTTNNNNNSKNNNSSSKMENNYLPNLTLSGILSRSQYYNGWLK